ncbi:MAG: hypothetical protein PWQ82_1649 [Thermosediminibacterales bacterium]|nr:hypothetical protein [Thermosediminibacterales bacterium]MDK2836110.1 hypothetical protein [Thermosediminibacterales bacterium]
MTSKALKKLIIMALFTALVTIATMVIQIPTVATQGFINVGDTMIFAAGIIMGPKFGLVAGGLGSALADMLSGYSHWAPWTLVIKGVEGLIVGILAHKRFETGKRVSGITVLATLVAAVWMIFGYYIAGGIMKGFPAALASIPANVIQGVGSVILAIPLLHAFCKINIPKD